MTTQTEKRSIDKVRYGIVAAESTYGTQEDITSGSAAFRAKSIQPEKEIDRVSREDYPAYADFEQVDRRTSAKVTIESYLMSGAAEGTAPDLSQIYEAFFGNKNTGSSTTVSDPGTPTATTTSATFTSVSGLSTGMAVAFHQSGTRYIRHISNIAGNVVTWTPALPSAPSDGDTVYSCTSYSYSNTPSISMTLLHCGNNFNEYIKGAVPTELSIDLPGSEECTVTIGLGAKDVNWCGRDALDGGINDTVTSITVQNGNEFSINSFIQIDDEVMKISDISGTTLTVSRGEASTSAASHSDGAIITPYQPSPSFAGSPIAGINGECWLGGEVLKIKKASFSLSNGIILDNEQYGSSTATGFAAAAMRTGEITLECELYTDTTPDGTITTSALRRIAEQKTQKSLFIQAGTSANACAAIYCPQVELNPASIPMNAGGITSFTITAKILESTYSAADGVYLHFN